MLKCSKGWSSYTFPNLQFSVYPNFHHTKFFLFFLLLLIIGLRFSRVCTSDPFQGKSLYCPCPYCFIYFAPIFPFLYMFVGFEWFDCRIPAVPWCLDFSPLFHGIFPYKGCFSIKINFFFSSSAITCHNITSSEAIPQRLYSFFMFILQLSNLMFRLLS